MDSVWNAYPNIDNYPIPSFPQAIQPPGVDPDNDDLIYVAYNKQWQKSLLAAAMQLCQYSTLLGDHDQKIEAMNRATLLVWLLQMPVEVGETDWPTPFWDDDTSVDDEQPADEQDWYGEVTNPDAPANELTFVENAVIWLLTGFVAIAASPSGPGAAAAAIFFRTTAIRFTLAFNRGDVREVFRVVVDAIDYGEVDTDALAVGEVVELSIDGLEDIPVHEIMLIKKV